MKQKYRIALIGKNDAYYKTRSEVIGLVGTVKISNWSRKSHPRGPWVSCYFWPDKEPEADMFFHAVILKKLGKRKIVVE